MKMEQREGGRQLQLQNRALRDKKGEGSGHLTP